MFKMFASLIFVFAVFPLSFGTIGTENTTNLPRHEKFNNCFLPPYPEHGTYKATNYPSALSVESYSSLKLDISCDIGYFNNNTKSIFCINGDWSAPMPICVRDLKGFCKLPIDDLKVEYRCLFFPGTLERSRECNSLVPSGTVVRPICRFPAYFSFSILPEMHCKDGMWDSKPICEPACGLTTQHLHLEGTSSNHHELPWHASLYKKKKSEYNDQHCSGSLITDTKIISAASCFYDYKNELLPASDFMVAVNKMYRLYNDIRDRSGQLSDVTDIKIPSSYRGKSKKYEDDIAIVVVKSPFHFHLSVRPVCLNFDKNLDNTQVTDDNSGKTLAWSWSDADGESEVLNVVDISYVQKEACEYMLANYNRPFLAKDKFCAKYNEETRSDATNEGNGLVFFESNTHRYHLQGVYTDFDIAIDSNTWIITYTSIAKHENFIKENL